MLLVSTTRVENAIADIDVESGALEGYRKNVKKIECEENPDNVIYLMKQDQVVSANLPTLRSASNNSSIDIGPITMSSKAVCITCSAPKPTCRRR
jgi:hypothetical protein